MIVKKSGADKNCITTGSILTVFIDNLLFDGPVVAR